MNITLPEGLTMRPPTIEDLAIVHKLILEEDLKFYGEEDFTLDDLRLAWTAPKFDFERNERLVFAQDGSLLACLHMDDQLYVKFFIKVRVRPGYSDPQLGDYLLELGETWARERMTQAEPGVRVSLDAWTSSKDEEMLQRYTRNGYSEVRRFWDMEIVMDELPAAPVWPEGVELRPYVPGRDDRPVFDMIEEAFKDHWGFMPHDYDEWQHRRFNRPDFDPSLWFVAYAGTEPVGGALCINGASGWVDILGIVRSQRGKGLGLALLRQAFREFYSRGQRRVGLGVDSQNLTGAVRLYKRAGMHIARERISYEKELRAGVEPSTQTLAV